VHRPGRPGPRAGEAGEALPCNGHRREAGLAGSGGSGSGLGGGLFGRGQGQGTSVRYACLTCNHRFKGGDCPRCGSKMKRADF